MALHTDLIHPLTTGSGLASLYILSTISNQGGEGLTTYTFWALNTPHYPHFTQPKDSYSVSPMPTYIVHPSELRLSKATLRFNQSRANLPDIEQRFNERTIYIEPGTGQLYHTY